MQPGLIFVYNTSTENAGMTLEETPYRLVQKKIYKARQKGKKHISHTKHGKPSLIHT